MSNIEPTEEQLQAAYAFAMGECPEGVDHELLGRFIADREHVLREQVVTLQEKSARRLEDGHAIGGLVGAIAALDLEPGGIHDRALPTRRTFFCSGCGLEATVTDPSNGAARCADYPRCIDGTLAAKPSKDGER